MAATKDDPEYWFAGCVNPPLYFKTVINFSRQWPLKVHYLSEIFYVNHFKFERNKTCCS